jgi:CBS domain-containing protein
VNELALDAVGGRTVAEVMMTRPKVLAADATVSDARAVFANPKVQTCPMLNASGGLVAELAREQLPDSAADDEPARGYASAEVETIAPDAPAQQALDRLAALGGERLCVVDAENRLTGLLCLNGRHNAFCTDKA